MAKDPWYTMASDDELRQGDILANCNIIIPKPVAAAVPSHEPGVDHRNSQSRADHEDYGFTKTQADIVVLTQTCDLGNEKVERVIVCPIFSLDEFYQRICADPASAKLSMAKRLSLLTSVAQSIRGGKTVGRYMLGPCILKKWQRGIRIVDFDMTSSVPYGHLRNVARGQRQRLMIKEPHREGLVQAFAMYFMRVALDRVESAAVNAEIQDIQKKLESTS
jgi:hypothetical protein